MPQSHDLIARIPTDKIFAPEASLDQLAATIRDAHDAACLAAEGFLDHALDAGAALLAARKKLKRGEEFQTWVRRNCSNVSDRSIRRYQQLARARATLEANRPRVADLSLRGALQLIGKKRSKTESTAPANAEIVTPPAGAEIDAGVLVPEWAVAFNRATPEERTRGFAALDPADIIAVMPDTFMARADRVIDVGVPHARLSGFLQTILNHIDIADDPKTGQTPQRSEHERAALELLTRFAAQLREIDRDVHIVFGAAKKRAA
jgi:hypothetical protein